MFEGLVSATGGEAEGVEMATGALCGILIGGATRVRSDRLAETMIAPLLAMAVLLVVSIQRPLLAVTALLFASYVVASIPVGRLR